MIGIFDSGIGGLTVAKSILQILPEYRIMYLGDTARLPYGNRSQDLIYEFTKEGVDFLFAKGCELIILACNTASAQALRRIQTEYLPKHYPQRRVLGVIRPLAEEAARATKTKRLGVVGTRGTVSSLAYVRELEIQNPEIKTFQSACPLLVPLIEEGWMKRRETKTILRYYMRPLHEKKIDTLILGCTHYQMLFPLIVQCAGRRVRVLHPGDTVAYSLKQYLERHSDIESGLIKDKNHVFYATDITDVFSNNSRKWLGRDIQLEQARLGT